MIIVACLAIALKSPAPEISIGAAKSGELVFLQVRLPQPARVPIKVVFRGESLETADGKIAASTYQTVIKPGSTMTSYGVHARQARPFEVIVTGPSGTTSKKIDLRKISK
jgi:hypothetical protein